MAALPIKIIHLLPERWKEYKDIYLEELKKEPEAFLYSDKTALKYPDSYWKNILRDRPRDIYFAFFNGIIAGMAGISYGPAPKNNHVASLWGVYVKKDYRGKNIARKLISKIIIDLKKKPKIVKLSLGVVQTQKSAIKLYKSLGFNECGLSKMERFVNGRYLNLYSFEKII